MTALQSALDKFTPELHNALRRSARTAIALEAGVRPYALHSVSGSLWHYAALPQLSCAGPPDEDAALGEAASGKAPREAANIAVRYNLPLWSSKVGGFGFIPRDHPYPRNTKTNVPLQLLAQVNFRELHAQLRQRTGQDTPLPDFAPGVAWPTHGILAFYIDPSDDLYGCTLQPRAAQDGYRVLFFPTELEERVYPLVDAAVQDGAIDAARMVELEAAVAKILWTREEQYALFNECPVLHSKAGNSGWFGMTLANPDAASAAARREARAATWLLPPEGDASSAEELRCRPSLWYAQVILSEHPWRLASKECTTGTLQMVPLHSVEFAQRVLPDAKREHETLPTADGTKDGCGAESFIRYSDESDTDEYLRVRLPADYLGGYPQFTQSDPRYELYTPEDGGYRTEAVPEAERALLHRTVDGLIEADMLLVQLGECNARMMWGDAGMANFFISADDFANRRFDKAWFNWDCC